MLTKSNNIDIVGNQSAEPRITVGKPFYRPLSATNILCNSGILSRLCLPSFQSILSLLLLLWLLLLLSFLFPFSAGLASASLALNISIPESIDLCEPEAYSLQVSCDEGTDDISAAADLPAGFGYSGASTIFFGELASQCEPSLIGQSLRWDLSTPLRSCRHIVINEFEQNPKGSDSGKEWVELYNPSSHEVKIGGWRIVDSYYRKAVVIPQDTAIGPGGFVVVVWTSNSLINSRALSLSLEDDSGWTVDCTPGFVDEGDDDRCWARTTDGKDLDSESDWALQASTRGFANGGKVHDLYSGEAFFLEFWLAAGCKADAGKSLQAVVSSTAGSSSEKSLPINIKRANLSLSVTPDRFEAAKGDRVTWRISLKNEGNGTARGVLANASLGSGLELLSIDSPGGGLRWSYETLGPGEAAEVELKMRALYSCDSYSVLVNASWGCGPCQALSSRSEIGRRTALRKLPDGPRSFAIGEKADFQIEADLPASCAGNLQINDSLSPGLIFDEASFYCNGAIPKMKLLDDSGGENSVTHLRWLFEDVISASSIDIGYGATVANSPDNQNGLLLDGGTACMSSSGLVADCDEAGGITIVEPDLVLEAVASSSVGNIGDEISYTLSVFHSAISSSPAYDVDLWDMLPPGLCCVPGSAAVVSGAPAAFDPVELKWHFDSLDLSWNADRKVVLRYNATISQAKPGDKLGNNATLTWSSMQGDNPLERDGSGGVNDYVKQASSQVDVIRLSISKESNPDTVSVGEPLAYTLTYENQGEVAVRNVTITDELDPNLLFVSSSPPGDGANTTWKIPLLLPDGPHSIEINALVDETVANGTRLVNRFSMECDEISPVRGMIYTDVMNESRLNVNKTAKQKAVRRGEEVAYFIKVCNSGGESATNVTVRDVFSSRVELVYASPQFQEGTGTWHFDSLEPGECVELVLVVRVPREDVLFTSEQKINGSGFLRVSRDYTTSLVPYELTNTVFVTSDQEPNRSAAEKVAVIGEAGTDLMIREHGSGSYESVEQLRYLSTNKSLELDRLLEAHHQPTSFQLPGNRSESFSSRWSEFLRARNGITASSFRESYRNAVSLVLDDDIHLDENGSDIRLNSDFHGLADIESKKAEGCSKGAPVVFESYEDYTGGFSVQKSFQEHGKNVFSDDSLSGIGYACVDKRVKNSQRSYEVGTGPISLDETIQSSTGFLAKKVDVRRGAASYPLAPDAATAGSMEWREGLWSNSEAGLLVERFFSVERLKKTAVFRGLRELESEADFLGVAEFRAEYRNDKNESNQVDVADEFVGEFYLKRRILLAAVSKYDRPHLSLTIADNSDPDNSSRLKYIITVKNDGNAALGPVYLMDLFPPGTEYIGSSVGPSELTHESANWTLLSLGIGGSSSIELELNATVEMDGIVNRIEAAAAHSGQWIFMGDFSAVQRNYLPCCTPDILISKEAVLEPGTNDIVDYSISLHNPWNFTMAVSVVDSLPAGMRMLGSSMLPWHSDSNSNRVTWKIIDLLPGQTKAIEYRAQAQQKGVLVNSARIEAFAVDGSGSSTAKASAVIEVNAGQAGDISGWRPPVCFGLNYSAPCAGDDLAACCSGSASPKTPEILCASCTYPDQ